MTEPVRTADAHIHDLMNRLSELQSRVILGREQKSCLDKLEEAIAEVRALSACLSAADVARERHKILLRPLVLDLKSRATESLVIGVTPHNIDTDAEVYGNHADMRLVTSELIRNSQKAHATKMFVSAADRGGHSCRIMFHDNGDGMSKAEVDNLGFGPKSGGRGGCGVSLVRGLVHGVGGHIQWLPSAQKGNGSIVILTLEKALH